MTITAQIIGSLVGPEFHLFANDAKLDVYTVSSGNRLMTLADASFANDTGSAVPCKLYHYVGTTTTERLFWTGSVAANATDGPDGVLIRLAPNDVIRAKADAGVTLTLSLVSQLENTR